MTLDKNEKQHDNNNPVKKTWFKFYRHQQNVYCLFLKQSYATVQEVKSSECIDSKST